ncbi:MAG: T9SS type A sorting domain-containing protein [Bacteroidetes bacterium]|nr:T9SS type A sorting domain-containing protein [Bacteroidota bacterium]
MKKLIIVLGILLTTGLSSVFGQVVLTENFNYTSANVLVDDPANTIWKRQAGDSTKFTVSGGLTFGNYSGSGIANGVTISTVSPSNNNQIKFNLTTISSGTVYSSFLMNVNSALQATDQQILAYSDGLRGVQLYARKSGSQFQFGIRKNTTGTVTYSTQLYNFSTTYMVVLKTVINAGSSNDTHSLIVFDSDTQIPSIEPSATITPSDNNQTDANIGRVQLHGGVPGTFDGLRITRTWAEAVSILANRVAAVTSGSVSSISQSTATVTGTLTSLGWTSGGAAGTISERGVAWDVNPAPARETNAAVSADATNAFSANLTGLPAGQLIYARPYAVNATGTAYGSQLTFYTFSDEPSSHSSTFFASYNSPTSIALDWDFVSGAAGYVVLRRAGSAPTGLPTDGAAVTVGQVIGNSTVAYVGSFSSDTSAVVTGLSTNVNYHFKVIPFGYDGVNPGTYNYKTDGTISATNLLLLPPGVDAESDIVETPGFSYNSDIPYITFSSSDLNVSNSVALWGIRVRDGGADETDSDVHPTTLSQLDLSITNHTSLNRLGLYDGNTELAEVEVTGSTVSFTGFTVTADDNTGKNLTLRASFRSAVTDNQQIGFSVTGTGISGTSSVFSTPDGGAPSSSLAGNVNRIEVSATIAAVTSQPSAGSAFEVGAVWVPSIVASFVDGNNNLDTDYSASVSVVENGSGLLSNSTVTPVSGVATFSALSHNTVEALTLSLSAPGIGTIALNSVSIINPQSQLFVEDMYDGSLNTPSSPYNTNTWIDFDNSGTLTFSSGTGSPTLTPGTLATTAPVSTNYSGASGSYYVNLAPNQGLSLGGINTTAYSNLRLSFGFRFSTYTVFNSSNTFLEYSTNGTTWTAINVPGLFTLPTSNDWYYISNLALPQAAVTANLRLRWRHTLTNETWRIDDVRLTGSLVLASQPSVLASSATTSSVGNSFLTLSWTNGNGGARMVLAKEGSAVDALPVDGTGYSANTTFGQGDQIGTGNFVVYSGTGSSVSVSGLSQGSTYHFSVVEFNGSGTTANYMASGLTASETTINQAYAELSDIIVVGESESISISSLVNQASPLSSTTGAPVWGFTIRDGGTGFEFDAYPTQILSLVIKKGTGNTTGPWSSVLKGASLLDGTAHVADAVIGDSTLTFTFGSPLSVPDGASRSYSLRVSLNETGLTDNQTLGFRLDPSMIQQDEPGSATSRFAAFAEIQSGVGLNRIAVTATRLMITQEPVNTVSGDTLKPSLSVAAVDANQNADSDFTSEVSVSSLNENLAIGSETTVSATAGSAVFDNLVASGPDPSVRLFVSASGLQNDTTKTFVIRAVQPVSPVTGLVATQVGNTSFQLQWNNPGSGSVLVTMRSGSGETGFPVDGQVYDANSEFGAGDEMSPSEYVVYSGSDTSVTITGLTGGVTYYYYAYRFNGDGATTNYLGTASSGSQTTVETAYASLSDVVAVEESEAISVSSLVNQPAPLSASNGASVWAVSVRDGGGVFEFDNLPTELLGLKIFRGPADSTGSWTTVLNAASLFDGTTHLADAIIGDTSLIFSFGSAVSVPDGQNKTLSLRISLKPSGLTDNQTLGFAVTDSSVVQAAPGSSTSRFASFSPVNSASNMNRINVIASQLNITQSPDLTVSGDTLKPFLWVEATDANLNLDTDYSSDILVSSLNNNLTSGSTATVTATDGFAEFSGLVAQNPGASVRLVASSGSLQNDTTNVFVIRAVEPVSSVTGLVANQVGNTFFRLQWNNPGTGSVLVTMRSGLGGNGLPVDGLAYNANSVFGEGDEISPSEFVVYSGSDTSVNVTGLTEGEIYHFRAYRFNGNGETANYLQSASSGSQATVETAYASLSDVVAVAESETIGISSIENAETINAKSDGVEVWSFRIRDGGEESFEFDSYDTEVLGLDIVAGEVNTVPDWSAAIQAAALFAGTEKVADAIVGESSMSFTFGTPVVAPDGGHITLNLVLSLNPAGITDGQQFSFAIDETGVTQDEPGSATSRFTTFAAGSATGTNVVSVMATSLQLVSQPDDVPVGESLADLLIRTVDANGVLDIDVADLEISVTVNNNTLDAESQQTVTFNDGIATFTGLVLTQENLETSLTFNAGEYPSVSSDAFRVFTAGGLSEGSVLISQFHQDVDGQGTAFIELANPGSGWQDLRNVNLVIQDGSGNTVYSAAVGDILPPNTYWLISSSETIENDRSGLVNADQVISIEVPESGQIALITNDLVKLDGVAYGSVAVNNLGDGEPASGTLVDGWKRVFEGVDTDENNVDFESVTGFNLVIKNSQSGIFVEEFITLEDDIPVLTIMSGTVGSSVTVTRQLNLTGSAVYNTESSVSIVNDKSWAIGNGNGWFTGEILRHVQSEATYRFPVGSETASFDVNLTVSGVPESGTMFYVYYRPTDPDVVGELPLGILDYYTGGFWTINTDGVNGTGSVSLTVDTENIQDYFLSEDRSDYVLLVRTDNESPWMIASGTVSVDGYLITAENINQYGEFTIGFYDESTVPVELSSFELIKDGNSALLKWSTRTENNNYGFHVEQAVLTASGRGAWKSVDFVSGKGTTTSPSDYEWAIRETSKPAVYRLRQVDLDGSETILEEVLFEGLATRFAVLGNYPNPFNPTTLIRVSVPEEGRVRLSVVNVLGQEVRTLIDDKMMPGITDIPFDASGLASGMYWAVFSADGQKRSMIRMILLK